MQACFNIQNSVTVINCIKEQKDKIHNNFYTENNTFNNIPYLRKTNSWKTTKEERSLV